MVFFGIKTEKEDGRNNIRKGVMKEGSERN